jgi:hypothetical protein
MAATRGCGAEPVTLTIIPGSRGTSAVADGFGSGARVQNAIANAASSTGVDFKYLYHQAKVESGLNPNAQASTSSASGLYQFTNQTWLATIAQHGAEHGLGWAANAISRGANGHYYVADETTRTQILALRKDPETSAAMAGEYASDNRDYLQAKLGRSASSVDLYMAHFLGPAGAARFLSAKDSDPDQAAASVMPAAARANRWVFYNKDGSARSVSDVYQRFAARFDQSEGAASTGAAAATPTAVATGRPTDTSAELVRMQLAALNGTTDSGMTSVSEAGVDPLAAATSQSVLNPSPQTARLAYLMLASLGV